MTVRALVRVLLLATAFALATFWFGWWTVPVVAAIWGVLARGLRSGALVSACAAGLAWGALLLWDASAGPVSELAATLGTLMHLPPIALPLATLVFPALLAWSATMVTEIATRVRD